MKLTGQTTYQYGGVSLNNWTAPARPSEYAEDALVTAILDGVFPPNTTLPGERDLAAQLGVTRPTLREAVQRLARDGWLTVAHGKSTVVNNYWEEGGLNVLGALVAHPEHLPRGFITHLLQVRLQLAPAYTRDAVAHEPRAVVELLNPATELDGTPEAFAEFDWYMHRRLTILSGNPIYTLILNGFAGFYADIATLYFGVAETRELSYRFYAELAQTAVRRDAGAAEALSRSVMERSIAAWRQRRASLVAAVVE